MIDNILKLIIWFYFKKIFVEISIYMHISINKILCKENL